MYQTKQSRITTVSAFKKELSSMNVEEPVVVTQNGEPLYVVQDPAQYEMQQEQMAFMKLMSFAEKDLKAGRTLSSNQLRSNLEEVLTNDGN
ncbi:type II toxin-antitoxin system Phd/YefM family antitoxin [Idiomarina sp. M1R2S28]|uniref:Type II toxin-antitoxin system Phd/YefM family antitoxin n=1 Tax=Idiomarina rhizosphaerae TaxID=2961572 RepID=A0A9X2FX07_9GAMM|nr:MULTISPECIES: type II toxin-antitoxin system prevent-host-death family antitoxin [Idiomarina]MCP1339024.1 type II toxin-antitoxin system Phd/YefM family antitoxin [Idiomarina rhizosphaerae]MRJ45799.1 type II toxin-antitoxin system prevent-host-death family antitoxin [Idiomarina loihiensis]TDO46470.1 prevent-host-death family protein [Idiomarina sp. 017G]UTW32760.1 type II toxin-antitoxin system Phd/YefM family antitoxin [Idiomarina loihiensis]|tara:strand:- start:107 stop:379 length:273 start_codon:yes stop_codon:yes gene_type:complete